MFKHRLGGMALLFFLTVGAEAQEASVTTHTIETPQSEPALVAPACHCIVIPALTPMVIEVVPALGSRISKTGETFAIRLSEPIMLDGKTLIPAGTEGVGEVVHAKKPGGSGAPGELVLAARYLQVGERRIRLRSMNFSAAGSSNYKTVDTLLIASSATILPVSLIGFGITGKDTNIPAGTHAGAKTAEAFEIPDQPQAQSIPENPQSELKKEEMHENQ